MFDPALGRVATDVAGIDGVRIWHDQALVKGAYANPTAFHLDVPYWSFTSADAITIWVALDDATLENGCLYYMPASHKAKKFDNVGIGPSIGALFDVYPEWRGGRCAAMSRAGGRGAVPQRVDFPRRRCQHDAGAKAGDDMCLYARRLQLQRDTQCPAPGLLGNFESRGFARQRRSKPACLFPERLQHSPIGSGRLEEVFQS